MLLQAVTAADYMACALLTLHPGPFNRHTCSKMVVCCSLLGSAIPLCSNNASTLQPWHCVDPGPSNLAPHVSHHLAMAFLGSPLTTAEEHNSAFSPGPASHTAFWVQLGILHQFVSQSLLNSSEIHADCGHAAGISGVGPAGTRSNNCRGCSPSAQQSGCSLLKFFT